MPQGMDPSLHPSARKVPGNPQASLGYGQVDFIFKVIVLFCKEKNK